MNTNTLELEHQQHHALTADAVARVILSAVLEPGDSAAEHLVATLGAAETVRAILDTGDNRAPGELRDRSRLRFSIGGIEQALRAAARYGVMLITPEHEHWPTRVNDLCDHAPVALWVRGNAELLTDDKTTAIVAQSTPTPSSPARRRTLPSPSFWPVWSWLPDVTHGATRAAPPVISSGSPVLTSTCESRFKRQRTRTACTVEAGIPSRPTIWTGPSRFLIRTCKIFLTYSCDVRFGYETRK